MRRPNARHLAAVAVAVLLGVAPSVVQKVPATTADGTDTVTSVHRECIAPGCSGGGPFALPCNAANWTVTDTSVVPLAPEPTMVALLGFGLLALRSARKFLNG
jgi:hypothetical protein